MHSIDVSADANAAVAGLGDNTVLIYDLDRDVPVAQLEDGHSTSVSQVYVQIWWSDQNDTSTRISCRCFPQFAPTHVASGGNDEHILLW